MRRKEELRKKARALRTKGLSYGEINTIIPVSKSSISLWCRDIILSSAHILRLKKLSLQGSSKARANWNIRRQLEKKQLLENIGIKTKKEIGVLSNRDRFIAGVMLYAGEGDKTQERVGMSNGNPRLLNFALNWFCEFLNLDRDRFVVHLYLHVGRSEKKAKNFWVKALRISNSQIKYIYRPKPKISHKGNIHEFGICSIRINNKMAHRQIMGWINAVLNSNNIIFPGSSAAEQAAVSNIAASSSNRG